MRILIIATPRCGSTTLTHVFSKVHHLRKYLEPYNYDHPDTTLIRLPKNIPEKVVTKTMYMQLPDWFSYNSGSSHDFYKEEIKKYDHVVVLTRRDILLAYESYNYMTKVDPLGHWHTGYIYREADFDIPQYSLFLKWHSEILEFANKLNLPITWYEDLYSKDLSKLPHIVNNWNTGITVQQLTDELKNHTKYRKTSDKKTLI